MQKQLLLKFSQNYILTLRFRKIGNMFNKRHIKSMKDNEIDRNKLNYSVKYMKTPKKLQRINQVFFKIEDNKV